MTQNPPLALMTVDVEDWFQPATFKDIFAKKSWDGLESRVVASTRKILRTLEEGEAKGTFFVLGWVASRYPELVREIQSGGHEIASHGNLHDCIYDLTPEQFAEDIRVSSDVIQQITGEKLWGYRAPNFSITDWAVDILIDAGFRYDSSYFPTVGHDRYGKFERYQVEDKPAFLLKGSFYEVPLSSIRLGKQMIPWSGGGYFRLLPYPVFRRGVKKIIRQKSSFNFYIHPWELDPGQPPVENLSRLSKFRHYNKLKQTPQRFSRLVKDFTFGSIRQYLVDQKELEH